MAWYEGGQMNREDIVRMAIESQLMTTGNRGGMYEDALCEFANLVAEAERERCAKIALSGTGEPVQVATLEILRKERERIVANIMEIEK
jgi:hypothetical protein